MAIKSYTQIPYLTVKPLRWTPALAIAIPISESVPDMSCSWQAHSLEREPSPRLVVSARLSARHRVAPRSSPSINT